MNKNNLWHYQCKCFGVISGKSPLKSEGDSIIKGSLVDVNFISIGEARATRDKE